MGLEMSAQCLLCHLNKNVELAQSLGDGQTAAAFAKALMKLYLAAPEDATSPCFGPGTAELFQRFYGLDLDRFREEKAASNRYVLARMDSVRARIEAAPDPLFAGLQYALLGNYIDFSALNGQVSFDELDGMLLRAADMSVEQRSYDALHRELEQAKSLLYFTDNAGEIGFDRLFAEQIRKAYPAISITFCVRGGPALNDATREDAAAVGQPFPVIDNGSTIPGTYLPMLGEEARRAMDAADVILAKGQANVETLYGCGYPIYYVFLIKCALFMNTFRKPKLTPMLLREGEKI